MHTQSKFVIILFVLIYFSFNLVSVAQAEDDPPLWSDKCEYVEILSTLDGTVQPAYFLRAKSATPRPLIVSLHSWSAGYDQKDSLSWICIEKNYNYIHPHFRGSNNNPEACGSKFVIGDINDAITFALINAKVDTSQIHIIGGSGGGYATLLAYMKTYHSVKTFSAWVPISDLIKWYHESESRRNRYTLDIARATVDWLEISEDSYFLGEEEAIKRSPYYMETPTDRRKNSKLTIYAGIHDGYRGSVPITQSLLFYNKVVSDFDGLKTDSYVTKDDIIELLASRTYQRENKGKIGTRTIHYENAYEDKVKIVIFEGQHEILFKVALDHVDSK